MARRRNRKWIQAATARMARRGTLGSYGSGKSVKTMSRDVARGGAVGRKAQFALNMKRAALRRARRGAGRRLAGIRRGRGAVADRGGLRRVRGRAGRKLAMIRRASRRGRRRSARA